MEKGQFLVGGRPWGYYGNVRGAKSPIFIEKLMGTLEALWLKWVAWPVTAFPNSWTRKKYHLTRCLIVSGHDHSLF
jgi:hypothetical protein